MDEEACCKSGCGNTSGVLVAFRAKSDEWDLLSAFLHLVFACNGNLTCLSGLFFLGADGCTVIENHHEPPQNESWFLVWILSKVPRYSILCYIMLYIIQYIYIHIFDLLIKFLFSPRIFLRGAPMAVQWSRPPRSQGRSLKGATAFVAGMGGMGW